MTYHLSFFYFIINTDTERQRKCRLALFIITVSDNIACRYIIVTWLFHLSSMYSWRFSLPNARIKVTLRHDNHHHRINIFPCTFHCKQDNRARSYKRDFLQGRTSLAMVHGGFRHDWRLYQRNNICVSARHGGTFRHDIHTDMPRFHTRIFRYSACSLTAVLQT